MNNITWAFFTIGWAKRSNNPICKRMLTSVENDSDVMSKNRDLNCGWKWESGFWFEICLFERSKCHVKVPDDVFKHPELAESHLWVWWPIPKIAIFEGVEKKSRKIWCWDMQNLILWVCRECLCGLGTTVVLLLNQFWLL